MPHEHNVGSGVPSACLSILHVDQHWKPSTGHMQGASAVSLLASRVMAGVYNGLKRVSHRIHCLFSARQATPKAVKSPCNA